jgi:hypothetical protein
VAAKSWRGGVRACSRVVTKYKYIVRTHRTGVLYYISRGFNGEKNSNLGKTIGRSLVQAEKQVLSAE